MANIIFKSIRMSQPQGITAINWANPITNKLVVVIDPKSGMNLVTTGQSTITGAKTTVSIGGTYRGYGTNFGVNGADILTTNFSKSSIPRSFFAQYIANTNGISNTYGRLFTKGVGSGGGSEVLHADGDYTNAFTFGRNSNSIKTADSYFTKGAFGVPHTVVLSCPGITLGDFTPYIDGVPVAKSGSAVLTLTTQNDTDLYSIGNRPTTVNRGWDGQVGFFYIWDRALLDVEAQSIGVNPWQIFIPNRKTQYFFPTAPIVSTNKFRRSILLGTGVGKRQMAGV